LLNLLRPIQSPSQKGKVVHMRKTAVAVAGAASTCIAWDESTGETSRLL